MSHLRWEWHVPRRIDEWRSLWHQARLWVGVALHPQHRARFRTRKHLAACFLRGSGLEIGALHLPLPLPRGATARYVDRMSLDELRVNYENLSFFRLPPVDIVDDGERLTSVPTASADFVIASHVIEHCRDPIAAIEAWLRVLRPQGVLLLIVPDRRNDYDRARPLTSLEHLLRDYTDGPDISQPDHYAEHARLTLGVPESEITPDWINAAVNRGDSIHQHVWTADTFVTMLEHCRNHLLFPLQVERVTKSFAEFVVVARRTRD